MAKAVSEAVRRRIEAGGERAWRLADFDGLPFMAVAQALSRLSRQGVIERLGKGLYYRARPTAFGPSRPNLTQLRALPLRRKGVFPAGIGAANLLGFTTQSPAQVELATDGLSLPRQIVGKEAIVHTRRPESWRTLSETDTFSPRFPSQPRCVERAAGGTNGGQVARLLPGGRTLQADTQGGGVGAAAGAGHARGHRATARAARQPARRPAQEFEPPHPV